MSPAPFGDLPRYGGSGRKVSKKKMMRLMWGRGCWMCGDRADTVDHYMPTAKGGTNAPFNRRPACFSCNHWKGNRLPNDVLRSIRLGEGPPKRLARQRSGQPIPDIPGL